MTPDGRVGQALAAQALRGYRPAVIRDRGWGQSVSLQTFHAQIRQSDAQAEKKSTNAAWKIISQF